MKMMWKLIRLYENSRILTAWKLFGFYIFRRCIFINPKKWGWGTPRTEWIGTLVPVAHGEDTRPCMICRQQLVSAMPGDAWKTIQPYGGGEVKFIFSYGSCKFDTFMSGTSFTGIICDDCAELCIDRGGMTCDQD